MAGLPRAGDLQVRQFSPLTLASHTTWRSPRLALARVGGDGVAGRCAESYQSRLCPVRPPLTLPRNLFVLSDKFSFGV